MGLGYGDYDNGNSMKIAGVSTENTAAGANGNNQDINGRAPLITDRRGMIYSIDKPVRANGGIFLWSGQSGSMGAGISSDSEIFQLRWSNNTGYNYGLIRRVALTHFLSTTPFTAGDFIFKMHTCTGYTANGSGGSQADLVEFGSLDVSQDFSSPIPDTTFSDLRIATTGALSAGTRTAKAIPIGHFAGYVPNSNGYMPSVDLYNWSCQKEPLMLSTNTGFIIKCTVPATGVWKFGVLVEFCAVSVYGMY